MTTNSALCMLDMKAIAETLNAELRTLGVEWFVEPNELMGAPAGFLVTDEEGNRIGIFSARIQARDLAMFSRILSRMFDVGVQHGREALADSLRSLLGAAPVAKDSF